MTHEDDPRGPTFHFVKVWPPPDVPEDPTAPALEADVTREKLIIAMLEEFPSVRKDIEAFLWDEHRDEVEATGDERYPSAI